MATPAESTVAIAPVAGVSVEVSRQAKLGAASAATMMKHEVRDIPLFLFSCGDNHRLHHANYTARSTRAGLLSPPPDRLQQVAPRDPARISLEI